jgi:hypothetical protein
MSLIDESGEPQVRAGGAMLSSECALLYVQKRSSAPGRFFPLDPGRVELICNEAPDVPYSRRRGLTAAKAK